MHLGKVTILHISLRSIAEYFAKNSLRSFGKNFCKQFASLIWQKESLYRANFATFASLNICKIILNVRSAHYLQINLCTLAMLAHKLGPSLGFFGCLTLFYFGLLWQVGCRYTYCGKAHLFILGPLEKEGVNRPSGFYRSVIPISARKQIFILFPLDFRSTYGPDSSPFFDP